MSEETPMSTDKSYTAEQVREIASLPDQSHSNATVVRAGLNAPDPQPGDLIFLHLHGPVRLMIRLGQDLRPELRPYAHLTHVAVVIDTDGTLIEARWPKVRQIPLDTYQAKDYLYVPTHMDPRDAAQAVAYLKSCLGQPYGVATFVGTGTRMLTPGKGFIQLAGGRAPICSGLAATAMERGTFIANGLAAGMCPAEVALAFITTNDGGKP